MTINAYSQVYTGCSLTFNCMRCAFMDGNKLHVDTGWMDGDKLHVDTGWMDGDKLHVDTGWMDGDKLHVDTGLYKYILLS